MNSNTDPWYLQEQEPHKHLWESTQQQLDAQSSYREDVKYYDQLYYNFQTTATGGRYYIEKGHLKFNLVQACVDTAASLVLANKPVPFWQTTGGTWKEQRSAKKCSQFVTGQFHNLGVHRLMRRSVMDGLRGGLGVIYGYVDQKYQTRLECLNPLQLVMDHDESVTGSARGATLRRPIAREVLTALFPAFKDKIKTARRPTSADMGDLGLRRDEMTSDMVLVLESWHLPSIPGWDDGKHILALDNCTLLVEPYAWNEFPLALHRGWADRRGYVGQGLIERVRGDQERLNDLLKHIRNLQDLGSNAWVFTDTEAGPATRLTNKPMQVVQVDSERPPQVVVIDAVPPGLLAAVQEIVDRVMFREGINEASMAGQKPTGVESAVGIRAADDMGTRRQLLPTTMVEDHALDTAKLIVRVNDQAAQDRKKARASGKEVEGHKVSARVRRGRLSFAKKFSWDELSIDPDNPAISVFPMSSVSTTPWGRYAQYEQMTAKGWVDMSFALELFGMPDVDAFANLQTSPQDLVCADLEAILDGEDRTPDPMLPDEHMAKAVNLALLYYCRAKESEADQDVLDALRKYHDEALSIIAPEEPATMGAAPSQAPAPPPPGGVPASPMVPLGP